jgi:hypothetical protein
MAPAQMAPDQTAHTTQHKNQFYKTDEMYQKIRGAVNKREKKIRDGSYHPSLRGHMGTHHPGRQRHGIQVYRKLVLSVLLNSH